MSTPAKEFLTALRRQWRMRRAGTFFCSGLKLLRAGLALLIIYAWLDLVLAFSSEARLVLNAVVIGAMIFLLLWECIGVLGISRTETAVRLDDALGNPRQPVLSAYELQAGAGAGQGELHQFLIDRLLRDAAAALQRLGLGACFPKHRFKRELKLLLIVAAVGGGLLAIYPDASRIVLARIWHPSRDIPPHSPYRFQLTPAQPKVLYGGNIELRANVSGAPIRYPVYLLTRKGPEMDRAICFREGEAVFSMRLEKVVDALEFCFATGKARSRWQTLELLLQPKISLVKLTVAPPDYTRLAAKELILGQESFEGYKGSKAQLQLTSNRPLSKGTLTLTPLNGVDPPRAVMAEKSGLHTVLFSWEMQEASRLEARIEDVVGTTCAEPLQLVQKIVPDRPPEVVLHSPAPYSQATPDSVIPLQGSAADDLALRSVDLVHTVAGFRDRIAALGPEAPDKRFAFARELNLHQLGVLPGQLLEFYLEARDFNPDRTGLAASDLVRVEIISDNEYAEFLRANETLEQFLARYELVQKKLQEFQQALDELEKEMGQSNSDTNRMASLLDQLRRQNQAAQELFSKLAKEFQTYAIEAKWSELLSDIAQRLEGHGNMLQGMTPSNPKLGEVVQRLRHDFQQDAARVQQQVAQAEELVKVGRVMEHASLYLQLLSRQRQVVRQLQRYDSATAPDPRDLAHYGSEQEGVRKDLEAFITSLESAAAELPEKPEFEELRSGAQEFAKQLKASGASEDMRQATVAANNQEGSKSYRASRLALEKMESLLEKRQKENCPFAGLCKNRLRFAVREELQETLAQMLAGIMSRGGVGEKTGMGPVGGGLGDGKSGFSVSAHTRLNTPMFGPARTIYQGGAAQGGAGQGSGMGGPTVVESARERLGSVEKRSAREPVRSPELAPEKYRDALKRYFSQPEKKP